MPRRSNLSDEDLMVRFRDDNDEDAYKELFDRWFDKLKNSLRSYGDNIAEDAAQQTLIAVWQKKHSWGFAPWINTIAKRKASDLAGLEANRGEIGQLVDEFVDPTEWNLTEEMEPSESYVRSALLNAKLLILTFHEKFYSRESNPERDRLIIRLLLWADYFPDLPPSFREKIKPLPADIDHLDCDAQNELNASLDQQPVLNWEPSPKVAFYLVARHEYQATAAVDVEVHLRTKYPKFSCSNVTIGRVSEDFCSAYRRKGGK